MDSDGADEPRRSKSVADVAAAAAAPPDSPLNGRRVRQTISVSPPLSSERPRTRARSQSHDSALDEEQDLRARLEFAERRLKIAELRLNDWRVAARQVLNVLALGPRSNEKYKRETVENLERILMKLEQVQQVHFINCSFPAIDAQAPDFEMMSWDSLASSSWFVRWSPSWSVEVSLGGWHYIPFTLVIHVSKIKINGRFTLSLAPDMSYAWVSFHKDVSVDMTVDSEVTWGILNMPLQSMIEGMVKKGFDDWLRGALIEPNRLRINILADKLKEDGEGITDADFEKARSAAETARMRTPTADDSWASGIVSMVTLGTPTALQPSPSAAAATASYAAAASVRTPPPPLPAASGYDGANPTDSPVQTSSAPSAGLESRSTSETPLLSSTVAGPAAGDALWSPEDDGRRAPHATADAAATEPASPPDNPRGRLEF
mmetsp:Transcript_21167/g.55116  ORF Transcript_21167/g.55116 Transcript_21167/m.55116 type:complete len:433 (+) Transcript_21167:276-1574(+)